MKNFAWGESNTSELGNQPFVWYNLSMNVLTSVGILLLLTLILAFLQMVPGIFMLISHYASGKFSRRKASDLALFFILGVESGVVFFLVAVYAMLSALSLTNLNFDNGVLSWMMVGILVALGVMFPIYYYRRGEGTQTFISRKFARQIHNKAENVKLRTDALVLGFSALIPELIFTMPLLIVADIEIMRAGETTLARAGLMMAVALMAILPLIVMHALFGSGWNAAELERSRVKMKKCLKFLIPLLYILIAAIIVIFRILP